MKKKRSHGGARPGAGRKPLDPADRRRPVTVRLTIAECQHLETLGGTISEAIRMLIAASMSRFK